MKKRWGEDRDKERAPNKPPFRHCERSEAIHLGQEPQLGLLCFIAIKGIFRRRLRNLSALREPCVYIMANKRQGTIYTGVTSNLAQRAFQHRNGLVEGFTSRYECHLLVFYEYYERMEDAIAREKQIKAGSRKKKISLIESMNPHWRDLYDSLV